MNVIQWNIFFLVIFHTQMQMLKFSRQLLLSLKQLRDLMTDSLKNIMFDKILRLAHHYSLLYQDLLFILYFVIFHSQIPLLIIW